MDKLEIKNKILVIPDIHGRTFWKKCLKHIDKFDRIVFLGDYVDPYPFDGITPRKAINNLKKIIDFKRNNMDKVILLLGNHDMPYMFVDYLRMNWWHPRIMNKQWVKLHDIFKENKDIFKICHIEEDIIFTHAGIDSDWLDNYIDCDKGNMESICRALNNLTDTRNGLSKLFMITSERGGSDHFGSCIWNDVHDMIWQNELLKNPNTNVKPIMKMKQIFGHTIQVFEGNNGEPEYGKPIEFGTYKMLDCAKSFVLNTKSFTISNF